MQVNVRFNGTLLKLIGRARLSVKLEENSTIDVLKESLYDDYPAIEPLLKTAVPIVSGRHVATSHILTDGQEVAFLIPTAGG